MLPTSYKRASGPHLSVSRAMAFSDKAYIKPLYERIAPNIRSAHGKGGRVSLTRMLKKS